MKKLMITLASFCALNFSQAATTKKEDISFLKCVRKITDSKRADTNSLQRLFEMVKSYKNTQANVSLKACDELRAEVKELPKLKHKELSDNLDHVNLGTDYSSGYSALYILEQMINPESECVLNSVGADVAFGVAAGLGLGVGTCHRADGRVFGIIAPRASWGIGGGAIVTIGQQKFTIRHGRIATNEATINAGVIIAQRELDGDDDAFGLGLGIMLENDYTLPLKVLPIGNNFQKLRKQLLN